MNESERSGYIDVIDTLQQTFNPISVQPMAGWPTVVTHRRPHGHWFIAFPISFGIGAVPRRPKVRDGSIAR